MYAGRVVEQAPVRALFRQPMHPYTDGLLAAIPKLDTDMHRLAAIPVSIPDPSEPLPGCRFSPRCPEALSACRVDAPALVNVGENHFARCPPRLARMAAA